MSAESAILAGRLAAEALYADTYTAYAPNGTTMDADGYQVPAFTDMGTTTGKTQSVAPRADAATRYVTIGGIKRPVLEGGLHIPIDAFISAGALQIVAGEQGIGWEFECTASPDPASVGTRWLVVQCPTKTWATARRLSVAEVS